MGAVIVQCPSCQARFHLAQERIPEKGARVRCSRCEHRFYVTSTGDVSQSKPRKGKADGDSGSQGGQSASTSGSSSGGSSASPLELASAEASQPRVRKSREAATTAMDSLRDPAPAARPRSFGAAPQEDADLDDPQFLFDESQSSAELPYTPGDLGPEDEEPSSAALGDMTGRSRARSPDTDVTPHAPAEPPPKPELAASSGSWLSNDDEAIPDIRAHRDELAAQHSPATLNPEAGAGEPESPPSGSDRFAAEPPSASVSIRTEAPRTAPPEREPAAPAGRYAGAGGAVLVARSTPERSREAPSEGPWTSSLDRVSSLVSAFMAVALIFAGGHALLAQLGEPAGPERVRLSRGEISSVEVLHLRDAEGHRVLAVRGLLRSSGDSAQPRVQLQLIDAKGSAVGAPHAARPGFLGDAELATDKLAELLAPAAELPLAAGDARGFTVLIRDPPLDAERFALDLAG